MQQPRHPAADDHWHLSVLPTPTCWINPHSTSQLVLRTQAGRKEKEVTMKIRDQEITLPTSMVGNYPNPRWWDAYFARFFTGDQLPPDSLEREALEDVVLALAHEQEQAGCDIISAG